MKALLIYEGEYQKIHDERLPQDYEKCLVGVTSILKEAWNTTQTTQDKREKIQALSLAKECYSMKLDLLTNATVVDDAIRFVAFERSKDKDREQEVQLHLLLMAAAMRTTTKKLRSLIMMKMMKGPIKKEKKNRSK